MPRKTQLVETRGGSLIERLLVAFEHTRRVDEREREYWLAREYADILGYSWEGFAGPVQRGKAALAGEGEGADDHFRHVSKSIAVPKGGQRDIGDIELTRRACYLIGINGDPRKKDTVAAVQRYFAEQTRKQEIHEMLSLASSDADRLAACQKFNATEAELKEVAAPRLTRPGEHLDQIKRRGHKGLFNASPETVKAKLNIPADRQIEDFADPAIVKGMDLATHLTARRVRDDESLTGVSRIGAVNEHNHKGVRRVIVDSGVFPEAMPSAGDIRDVQARVEKQRAKLARQVPEGGDMG